LPEGVCLDIGARQNLVGDKLIQYRGNSQATPLDTIGHFVHSYCFVRHGFPAVSIF
jgi:hypothetical protein